MAAFHINGRLELMANTCWYKMIDLKSNLDINKIDIIYELVNFYVAIHSGRNAIRRHYITTSSQSFLWGFPVMVILLTRQFPVHSQSRRDEAGPP